MKTFWWTCFALISILLILLGVITYPLFWLGHWLWVAKNGHPRPWSYAPNVGRWIWFLGVLTRIGVLEQYLRTKYRRTLVKY